MLWDIFKIFNSVFSPELYHSGWAAQGAAARAGRVLHQPHDQVRRNRLPHRRPGLHLLLQRPLRRERLINTAPSLHLLLASLLPKSPIFLLCGESELSTLPLSFYTLCSYHFFLSQFFTFFPFFLPSPSLLSSPERVRVEDFAQILAAVFGLTSSSLISIRAPLKTRTVPGIALNLCKQHT